MIDSSHGQKGRKNESLHSPSIHPARFTNNVSKEISSIGFFLDVAILHRASGKSTASAKLAPIFHNIPFSHGCLCHRATAHLLSIIKLSALSLSVCFSSHLSPSIHPFHPPWSSSTQLSFSFSFILFHPFRFLFHLLTYFFFFFFFFFFCI